MQLEYMLLADQILLLFIHFQNILFFTEESFHGYVAFE